MYGHITLTESGNLQSPRINFLSEQISTWKKEESEAENSRTTSINKTIVGAFKGLSRALGGR